jgi:hypothetical protein
MAGDGETRLALDGLQQLNWKAGVDGDNPMAL